MCKIGQSLLELRSLLVCVCCDTAHGGITRFLNSPSIYDVQQSPNTLGLAVFCRKWALDSKSNPCLPEAAVSAEKILLCQLTFCAHTWSEVNKQWYVTPTAHTKVCKTALILT